MKCQQERDYYQKDIEYEIKRSKKILKRSIHRLYNKVVKNVRKRQYSNNKELRIRNNIS